MGGFIICFVTNFLSYKKTLFLYGFINAILWLLYLAFKPNLMIFGIVLRILQGLIISGFGCLIPVYLTSICPDDTAGFFGCLQQIGIASGLVIFLFLSAFINYQIVAIIGVVIEFIFCCLLWLMPTEKKERDKESIYKRDYALNIFVGMMLMFFQQFCGINALLGNLNKIMSKSSIDINLSLQSALANMTQLLSLLIGAFLMDVVGRGKMWIFSGVGMVLGFASYVGFSYLNSYNYLLAASMYLLMITFSLGIGPIPWFICHDLFPKQVHLDAQMFIIFSHMISSFAVVTIYPIINKKFNELVPIYIFIAITFLGIPFGAKFIPKKVDNHDDKLTLI